MHNTHPPSPASSWCRGGTSEDKEDLEDMLQVHRPRPCLFVKESVPLTATAPYQPCTCSLQMFLSLKWTRCCKTMHPQNRLAFTQDHSRRHSLGRLHASMKKKKKYTYDHSLSPATDWNTRAVQPQISPVATCDTKQITQNIHSLLPVATRGSRGTYGTSSAAS
jgi:hypothetical protein